MNEIDIGLEETKVKIADLSKELLVLRLAFGKLKATAADAFAPITVALTEGLQQATFAAIRLVKKIGAVIAALFGMSAAQNAVTKAVSATGKAVRNTLAGFDQLERLGSGGSGGSTQTTGESRIRITPEMAAVAQQIRDLFAPLQEIDLSPLQAAFARLGESAAAFAGQLGAALEWVWMNLLTPFAAWVTEQLAPMFTVTLKAALDAVVAALSPLGAGFAAAATAAQPVFQFLGNVVMTALAALQTQMQQLSAVLTQKAGVINGVFQNIGQIIAGLWQAVAPILLALQQQWVQTFGTIDAVAAQALGFLIDRLFDLTTHLATVMTAAQPVFQFLGDVVMAALAALQTQMQQLSAVLTQKAGVIIGIFQNIGQIIAAVLQGLLPILSALLQQWEQTFAEMSAVTARIIGSVMDGLFGLTEFLAGAFTGNWKRAWDGITGLLKAAVNLLIGMMNQLLSALTGALNGVVRVVNQLRFTAPDWVPAIGGKTFGFNLKTVSTPQIPYLAKGAVLPANRPFLAVVGDQRHGTNVEAPLSVIQEAVAQVLGDRLDGLMAGFDATVQELRSLHDTVSGIEVGDAVIGKAAARYQRKMAVVHGRSY